VCVCVWGGGGRPAPATSSGDGGTEQPMSGWLRAVMSNMLWASARPPSVGFGRGILQHVTGGSSFNRRRAGPPSTGDAPSGVLLQDALVGGLLQAAAAAFGGRWRAGWRRRWACTWIGCVRVPLSVKRRDAGGLMCG
jgi:hypothetical protein